MAMEERKKRKGGRMIGGDRGWKNEIMEVMKQKEGLIKEEELGNGNKA